MSSTVPRTNRTTQVIIWGIALILLILAVFAIRDLTREHLTVVTAQVGYADLDKTFSTAGKVEPIDDFQVHAQAAGQVEDIYVDEGDKVKAGELLLKLDDKVALANLAHAQSSLDTARLAASDIQHGGTQDERNTLTSDLNKAQLQRQQDATELAARQKLLAQGAESPAEVAEIKHRLDIDDANIASIQQHATHRFGTSDTGRVAAQIADASAAVTAAQNGLATVVLRSKIAGTVYYLPISQYDYVDPGSDLIYVADLTRMRVTAYFDEPDIGNLAAGQPVTITWEAKQGKVWHGHILQAPSSIKSYQQRFVGECLISVDDADGELEPNANVVVTVTASSHKHVLAVPHEALHQDANGYYVYRVVNDRLLRTPVQTQGGIMNLKQDEIVSGLSEDDTVAVKATVNRELGDGLRVTPVQ
jgi:HlyD family secretion protein